VRVSGTAEQGAVIARIRELLVFARMQGYQPAEVIAIIKGLR
jgi:hypothetical protein